MQKNQLQVTLNKKSIYNIEQQNATEIEMKMSLFVMSISISINYRINVNFISNEI